MRWEYTKLEEIAEFRNGVNFTSDSFGKGIKVINVADFKDRMYPEYNDLGELDSEGNWSKECFLKENDIVFVRSNGNKNLIGRSIFIKDLPKDILVTYSAFCIRLRFKNFKNIAPEFYLYLFKSPLFRGILSQFGNGTNISNLNQDILNNMVIPRPSLIEQTKIASILSAYDELIENNKQRIKLLEEMAEEIYKEWFVRLRFPGYETAKFVDSLPEGWGKVKISNAFDILGGGTPSTEINEFWEGGLINWFSPTDITGSKSIFLNDSAKHITEVGLKNSSAKLFPEKSVMMTSRATIGAIGINMTKACTNQGFITCIPNDNFPFQYIFQWIKNNRDLIESYSTGATFKEIARGVFKNLEILKPSLKTINIFTELVEPMFDEIQILGEKNQLLQQTRDLLLPRLISGKLSVAHLVEEEERLMMAAEPKPEYK